MNEVLRTQTRKVVRKKKSKIEFCNEKEGKKGNRKKRFPSRLIMFLELFLLRVLEVLTATAFGVAKSLLFLSLLSLYPFQ